jgi:3-oxoacyl-[acyl-carrier-protein] synthase II
MSKRVVVTGMGVVSPIGNSIPEFAASLKAGVCGIDRITQFDAADFDVKIAAEVKDFDPAKWMDKKDARKMARFTQFAVAATAQAVEQAGLLKPAAAESGARSELASTASAWASWSGTASAATRSWTNRSAR